MPQIRIKLTEANESKTRMHSSRMRTTRSLPYGGVSLPRGGEGSLSLGVSLYRGVSVWGLCTGGSLFGGSLSRGSLSVRGVSVQQGLCPEVPLSWGCLYEGGLCIKGLCPGGSLSRGVSVQGVFVQGVSVQGVSVCGVSV